MPPRPSPIRTWLQLFRAPNLFTVPGDPLAGYLLACFGDVEVATLWPAVAASLCFYAGGLLLNDLADLKEDRAERPDRPLPSGAASPVAAGVAAAVLFAGALALCGWLGAATLATGGALLAAIASYNLFTKRLPLLGALNMGACRGLSMLVGATAVTRGDLTYPLIVRGRLDHLVIAVALVALFIAAVTNLARSETKPRVPAGANWLPVIPLIVGGWLFLGRVAPFARMTPAMLFLVAAFSATQVALRLQPAAPAPIPPQIGQLIRLLLLIQAAFCAALGGVEGSLAAGALVMLWPISRFVGLWFYAS